MSRPIRSGFSVQCTEAVKTEEQRKMSDYEPKLVGRTWFPGELEMPLSERTFARPFATSLKWSYLIFALDAAMKEDK